MTKRIKLVLHYGEDSLTLNPQDLRDETIAMLLEDAKTLAERLEAAIKLCDKFLEKQNASNK